MHETQKVLLKRLLAQNNQRFSNLTVGYSYEDNIVFHLKQLLKENLIEKADFNYKITPTGIKEIFEITDLEDKGFKTFFVGFLCHCGDSYLLKAHPNAKDNNFYNLPSGKPWFGKKIEDELVRIFNENTGLNLKASDFKYLTLHLKTVKTSQNETLFDDAFAIYDVRITREQQKGMKLKPEIKWLTKEEITKLKNRWLELDVLILKNDLTPYQTYTITSDYVS